MKIDEPKTPFHYKSMSPASHSPARSPATQSIREMGEEMEELALAEHVDAAGSSDHDHSISVGDGESDEEEDKYFGMTADEVEALKAKEAKFLALRKQHYNMKAIMMKAKEFGESDEESDVDEDKDE